MPRTVLDARVRTMNRTDMILPLQGSTFCKVLGIQDSILLIGCSSPLLLIQII